MINSKRKDYEIHETLLSQAAKGKSYFEVAHCYDGSNWVALNNEHCAFSMEKQWVEKTPN